MKFLTNPIFLHTALILFCASFAFVLGTIIIRLLRKSIQAEADVSSDSPALETLPLHVYNTVIRQLKQQQDELKAQSRSEQQRSRNTERFHDAVLANLGCGVLNVGKNGLVKSCNPAGKQILGFASPVGMSVKDIFRGASVFSESDSRATEPAQVSDELERALESSASRRRFQTEYQTPAGEKRTLSITIAPVFAGDGAISGAVCLIDDIGELSRLRHESRSEIALETRAAGAGA